MVGDCERPPRFRRLSSVRISNCMTERSCILRLMTFEFALGLILLTGVAAAQTGPAFLAGSAAAGTSVRETNPVREEVKPFEFGALAQGGFGITQNRGGYKFF